VPSLALPTPWCKSVLTYGLATLQHSVSFDQLEHEVDWERPGATLAKEVLH
jgi:hypothetical protein